MHRVCLQLCCMSRGWVITTRSIDLKSGCCGKDEDTQELRNVTDLSYRAGLLCGLGRGVVNISSRDPTHPELHLKTKCAALTGTVWKRQPSKREQASGTPIAEHHH